MVGVSVLSFFCEVKKVGSTFRFCCVDVEITVSWCLLLLSAFTTRAADKEA
jgi:hypothetical protein